MNLDTRPLLATEGAITVRPSTLATGETICSFCVMRSNGCEIEPQRERCGHFVPALSFVSAEGLDGRFSTYRGSSVWYDRARVIFRSHKRFALVTTKGDFIGFAKIVDAHRASFAHLMAEHAHTNHLVLGKNLTKPEAAEWLKRWIKHNLGSRYVKQPDAIGTVIYLEREVDPSPVALSSTG